VLRKEYKFVPPPADADDMPDENGITNANIDFSWEKDVKIEVRFFSSPPYPVYVI
jgi:template-activating factor I